MPTQTIGYIGHFIHLVLIFQDTETYPHLYWVMWPIRKNSHWRTNREAYSCLINYKDMIDIKSIKMWYKSLGGKGQWSTFQMESYSRHWFAHHRVGNTNREMTITILNKTNEIWLEKQLRPIMLIFNLN